jgi:lipoprotein-releasing system permease protein
LIQRQRGSARGCKAEACGLGRLRLACAAMSRLPFELFLALRYLRPKRTFVSVITLISVLGVMLGVAVLIIVISVMTGFDRELREKLLGLNAHLKIHAERGTVGNYRHWMELIAAQPGVRGVAPYIMGQVLVKTQPTEGNSMVAAPWIRGIDPAWETNVTIVPDSVKIGEFDLSGGGLLVGTELAHSLRLNVGDRLAVYSTRHLEEMEKARKKEEELAILPEDYTVRGIFDVGYYEYNASIIVISLENAQDLYRLDDQVHGLQVMLYDPLAAESVREALRERLGPEFEISLWTEENSPILNALQVEKNVMFYLLFFIMIVAAFGIMNSLITFVVQKTREIGMLKALGSTVSQVVSLFLSQSLLVGFSGVISGFVLGMLALHYRNGFLHFMNRLTGLELFPASIYVFTELPALIVPGDVAVICGSALGACLVAGVVPAWIAARLQPVEALRHE